MRFSHIGSYKPVVFKNRINLIRPKKRPCFLVGGVPAASVRDSVTDKLLLAECERSGRGITIDVRWLFRSVVIGGSLPRERTSETRTGILGTLAHTIRKRTVRDDLESAKAKLQSARARLDVWDPTQRAARQLDFLKSLIELKRVESQAKLELELKELDVEIKRQEVRLQKIKVAGAVLGLLMAFATLLYFLLSHAHLPPVAFEWARWSVLMLSAWLGLVLGSSVVHRSRRRAPTKRMIYGQILPAAA